MWILDEIDKLSSSDTTALIHRDEHLSFSDVYNYSESISSYIVDKLGLGSSPILIYGNKDNDIVPCMLASLKSGRPYIPVDVNMPKERVLQIIQDSKCELVFDFGGLLLENNNFICIDLVELNKIKHEYKDKKSSKENWVKPDDTCYIIFTSGSTGKPKGVPITRKNIQSLVNWFSESCKLSDDNQVVLNQVSYAFDVSVIMLYIYLPMGKTLYSIDKDTLENLKEFFEELGKSNIGALIGTPALVEICCFDESFSSKLLPKLEKFILAGEVLQGKLVNKLNERFNNPTVINGYGPTEATVLVSACTITQDMIEDNQSLPVGRIMPDGIYRIIDENGKELPDLSVGELVVISNSVSKGYLNNPELSKEVFFEDESGKMGYHTGDLMFKKDDMLYYIARKNFQIKLNGFRIELEDIQSNINSLDYIDNSIALPIYNNERVSSIVSFVKLSKSTELSNIKLGMKIKNDLKKLIPSYMIPKKFIILDSFPMNNNGKIDRKKLMEGLN